MNIDGRPRICVDFQNTDGQRRVLLTTPGTRTDLARHGIELIDGLRLLRYSDDADEHGRTDNLLAEGIARLNAEMHSWVAEINWSAIRNESEIQRRSEEL